MPASHTTAATFVADVVEASAAVPVLVDFWAPWCGPCRMVGPILDAIADEQGDAVKVVKVNTDEEQALAAQFGIRSIPTMLVFRHGAPVAEMVGASPRKAILDTLAPHR